MSRIDPNAARTAEDFIMLLRQVRAVSELTYWQIEEKAQAGGYRLEPAVLVQALGQGMLPDQDVVAALLHACDYTDDEIEQWLLVHERIAAQPGTPADNMNDTVAHRARHTLVIPGRGSRRAPESARLSRIKVLLIFGGAALLAIASVIIVFATVGDNNAITSRPPAQPAAPGSPSASGYELPYATADPTPTSTPGAASLTPTPGVSATASSAPPATGIARSGTAALQNGQGIDLDTGTTTGGLDLVVYGNGDSLRADPNDRHFAPTSAPSKQNCAAASYQKTLQGLAAGSNVCVRTDRGAYGFIAVSRTAPLTFSYVVWS